MNTKDRIVRGLLRLYPADWRREYGAELTDVLQSSPLNARVVTNVLLAAAKQRARTAPPWAILGTAALAYMIVIVDVTGSLLGGPNVIALVVPSGITFPTFRVARMATDLFALALIICGGWTELRNPGPLSRAGMAGLKMSLMAGLPVVIAGLMSFASVRSAHPSALEVTTAPLLMLPMHFVYGFLGGAIASQLRSMTRWIWRRLAISN